MAQFVKVPPQLAALLRLPAGSVLQQRSKVLGSDFPSSPLSVQVQIAPGADRTAAASTWAWVTITAYVRISDGITITRGRRDEYTTVQPSTCQLRLDNTGGRFSPRNPAAPWFPDLRRGTPLRVLVNWGSGQYVRFIGTIDDLPPRWDASGNDMSVPITASGILRRIGQSSSPLRSSLYRATAGKGPLAHWPLEDDSGATQAASAVTGVAPMTAAFGTVSFAASSTSGGSAAAPLLINSSTSGGLIGTAPNGTNTTGWAVSAAFALTPTSPGTTSNVYVMSWTDSQGAIWSFRVWQADFGSGMESIVDGGNGHGGYPVGASNGADAQVRPGAGVVNLYDGAWHSLLLVVTPSGGLSKADLYVDGTYHDTDTASGVAYAPIGGAVWTPDQDWQTPINVATFALANIGLFDTPTIDPVTMHSAAIGYAGEQATDRFLRLCTEAGIDRMGTAATGDAMGIQPVAALVNCLREVEAADQGLLYESAAGGLTYTARSARYNASAVMALDVNQGHLGGPPEPTDDDQQLRNDVTVSRTGGSSGRCVDTTSANRVARQGTYDEQLTLNVQDDTNLVNIAGWRVHLGTFDEERWPTLTLNLAAWPSIIPQWLAMDIGSRFTVANPPAGADQDQIDVLLEGYTETLNAYDWAVRMNTSPARAYRVAVIEGSSPSTWRIDSDTATLAAAYPVGATSIQVNTTGSAELWSTSAGDYPCDINVGGVKVTVSAVAGGSSPQTFTVTALTYPLKSAAAVSLWKPPTIAL